MLDVTAVIKAAQKDEIPPYDSDASLTEEEIVDGISKLAADVFADRAAQESDIYDKD
jgi:hypothetical protein